MLYFGLDVQLRRGSVAGYTTDESWAYGPKEGVEAFESITFFIRFIYAINFEHLLIVVILSCYIPHRLQPPATRWMCSRQVFQRRGGQTNCLLRHHANASRLQEYG